MTIIKFELEDYHRDIPKKDCISDLKRVALKLNKNNITHKEYKKYGKFGSTTLRAKFGSWEDALSAAGLTRLKNMNVKENDLINDLIRVAIFMKKDRITQVEYDELGLYSSSTFYKYGSWFKALEKAGLKKTRNLGVTEEEYFKNIEEVWTKLGRQPHSDDMQKPLSKYAISSYVYRFGTWRIALKRFVEYINKETVYVESRDIENTKFDNNQAEYERKHKTKRNIPWRLRFIVMKRDNFKCKGCGRSPATDQNIIFHVDHIIPYSKGGETIFDNLQTLCSVCNLGKGDFL